MIVSSNGQLIYTISSYNKGATTLRLRSNIRSSFTKKQFISIKDILLYNFSIDESFIKIPSNIFLVTNFSFIFGTYFYLEVMFFNKSF